ncbi:hypothetical protein [Tenacibaculum sp. MAR_2009_124]|uniref:hypothetical protein n=1 Tax=Tenacibaculum sp. MAR_2009_124 TaxID=1250059 RepID=UPI00115FA4AC|nr:hypothetical protein [Tenacibaculum sp. MAR_2009_124]
MLLIQRKLSELLGNKKYYSNYYNQSISKYRDITCYISVYEKLPEKQSSILTEEKINHSDDVNFGDSMYSVKKKLNVPYSLVKVQRYCHVLFYKMRIGVYKIIVELHFFKNKLVFFKYTFPSLNKHLEIEKFVKKKYLDSNRLMDFSKQCIIDNWNSCLRIENEVAFSLYYVSMKFGFAEYLKKKKKSIKERKVYRESYILNELLERL